MKRLVLAGLIVAGAVMALAGCGGDLVGSCVQVYSHDHVCLEVHGSVPSARQAAVQLAVCGMGSVWTTDTCSTGNALGGCQGAAMDVAGARVSVLRWYFPSDMVRTQADARGRCAAGEGFVTP